ncbi:rRNA maturation RNase YbeY [Thermocrinis sp.]|uniref:rRNA maturation RNase YbeY n=1 Tax=Thermocrinis sp. TaxID=2024383 RepID=UPI002FDCE9EA
MKKNRVLVKKKVRGLKANYLSSLAHKILDAVGLERTELSILITSDEEIKELNKLYRNKDRPTDVLSFPMGEEIGGWKLLGDVVISIDTARAQAKELGISLEEEVKRLLIHGIVHLLGYDHELGEEEERRFKDMEEYIQSKIEPPVSR